MKKRAFGGQVLFLSLLLFKCFGDTNPLENPHLLTKYPLKEGNYWNYHRTYYIPYSFPGFQDTVISEYYEIECLGKEKLAGLFDTYPLVSTATDTLQSPLNIRGKLYYSNESDGMYLYGYTGSGLSMPKNSIKTIYFKEKFTELLFDCRFGRLSFKSRDFWSSHM